MADTVRQAPIGTNVTRGSGQVAPGAGGARRPGRLRPARHQAAGAGPSAAWWWLGWALPLALQLVHSAVVAPHYHVGSFDDDANYLMAAHVLASGGGLGATLPSGATMVGNYLPGYPLLLVPLVWAWGSSLVAPRLASLACVALLYPLAWVWMGRHRLRPQVRAGALVLLALNEVLATYSTMVMAEAPFLVVLLLGLMAVDWWEERPGWQPALASTVALGFLVWLKEAGVGLAVGLVLYWAWRRRWRSAAATSVGTALLLAPGLVARWLQGGSVLGNRYTSEIAPPGDGGFLQHLPAEVWGNVESYLEYVLRSSVLPAGNPLASGGPVHWVVVVLGVSVPVFGLVGALAWYRHSSRAVTWMVVAYFAETLAYPYNNQRRVVLVLPVVTVWYVLGAISAWRWAWRLTSRAWGRSAGRVLVAAGVGLALTALVAPSAEGFSANYLFGARLQSSRFVGNPAISLLASLGTPRSVVETDYLGSVAYFTGHRTAWSAFTLTATIGPAAADARCSLPGVEHALQADGADYLLLGDLNFPGVLDSPCLLSLVSSPGPARAVGAVRLLSAPAGNMSVFELCGPGSPQPGLADRTAALAPLAAGPGQPAPSAVALAPNGTGDHGQLGYQVSPVAGRARFTWSFAHPVQLSQLSLGLATASGPVAGTEVQVEVAPGRWQVAAATAGAVGSGRSTPYLLANLSPPVTATAARVIVEAPGPVRVAMFNAIGPRG